MDNNLPVQEKPVTTKPKIINKFNIEVEPYEIKYKNAFHDHVAAINAAQGKRLRKKQRNLLNTKEYR